jgi:hypothetical protein
MTKDAAPRKPVLYDIYKMSTEIGVNIRELVKALGIDLHDAITTPSQAKFFLNSFRRVITSEEEAEYKLLKKMHTDISAEFLSRRGLCLESLLREWHALPTDSATVAAAHRKVLELANRSIDVLKSTHFRRTELCDSVCLLWSSIERASIDLPWQYRSEILKKIANVLYKKSP